MGSYFPLRGLKKPNSSGFPNPPAFAGLGEGTPGGPLAPFRKAPLPQDQREPLSRGRFPQAPQRGSWGVFLKILRLTGESKSPKGKGPGGVFIGRNWTIQEDHRWSAEIWMAPPCFPRIVAAMDGVWLRAGIAMERPARGSPRKAAAAMSRISSGKQYACHLTVVKNLASRAIIPVPEKPGRSEILPPFPFLPRPCGFFCFPPCRTLSFSLD